MRKLVVLLFVLIVVTLMAVACGGAAPTLTPMPSTITPPAPATKAPTAQVAPPQAGATGKVKIVFIPKAAGIPYFDSLHQGFQKACQEQGCEYSSVAPASTDATSQIPFIKEQVQRGVNVIAIAPNSPDALNQVFDEARAKGVVVMIVNSDIPGSEAHRDVAVLPMDFNITGSSQVELMGSLIGYKGKIAILSATTDAPDQNFWVQGMKEALKNTKYKDMQLVDVVYGNDEPQKSLTECEGLMTKYSDLKGIIAPTTVAIAACAGGVQSAKRAPGLQLTGLGLPSQMRQYIKDGTVTAFALWSPYDEGYLSGYLAVGLATKQIKPGTGAKFTVPNLGEREFKTNNVVITGPPTIFNKDNIDNFKF